MLLPFYGINLSFFIISDDLRSFEFLTKDFYKIWEFYGFWSDIGLFEAYFVPLLNGGKFFLLTYTFERLPIIPFPCVAF